MIFYELEILDGMDTKSKRFLKVASEAFKYAVKGWHTNFLPGHFKLGAARKYGYRTRTEKYQKRKRKKNLPALVKTGRARDKLTRPAFFKTSASKGQAVGKFIVGSDLSYFYKTPKNGPDKPAELKKLTQREIATLRDFISKYIATEMNKPKTRKKRVAR